MSTAQQELSQMIGATDPFLAVEEWWGDTLSKGLVQKVLKAPPRQIAQFLDDIGSQATGDKLPRMSLGELRPIVVSGWVYDRGNPMKHAHTAVALSLYSHHVLLEDVLKYTKFYQWEGGEALRRTLEMLIAIRPLVEVGAIQFVSLHPKLLHPSVAHQRSAIEWENPLSDVQAFAVQRLDALSEQGKRLTEIRSFATEIFHLRSLIGATLSVADKWPGECQPLARSDQEEALLQIALDLASTSLADGRRLQLQKLLALDIPSLGGSIQQIAAIRRHSSEFADWRQSLAVALTAVEDYSDRSATWAANARDVIHAELAPLRDRLDRALAVSPAMSAVSKGLTSLTFSGLGALGGAAAGGSLGASLAGAATGKVGEIFMAYIEAVRERRKARALKDVVLKFAKP
jgi:hypothetical protein